MKTPYKKDQNGRPLYRRLGGLVTLPSGWVLWTQSYSADGQAYYTKHPVVALQQVFEQHYFGSFDWHERWAELTPAGFSEGRDGFCLDDQNGTRHFLQAPGEPDPTGFEGEDWSHV